MLTHSQNSKEKLWTKDYIFLCITNFLLSFAFYLLIPTLPLYLVEILHISKSMAGIVLSCFTIAVLLIRPFSGFIADSFARKPVYLIAYFLFFAVFFGYLIASTFTAFLILRIIHGASMGMLTTSGSTLVIDIMPSSRRGEGLGYYGIMGNIAMATGPMTGLFLYHSTSFEWIFIAAIIACAIGSVFAVFVKTPKKQLIGAKVFSLERFVLLKGIPAAICFMLMAMPYCMTTSYITLYLKESNFHINTGLFFTFMAVGMIFSRLSSGKKVDKGFITQTTCRGMIFAVLGFFGEIFIVNVLSANLLAGKIFFYLIALAMGYGFGTLFPALNTLFLNLAPHTRRATANATYLTGWDVGIGLGIYFGGIMSDTIGFMTTYLVGFVISAIALLLFIFIVTPHFEKNRLQ